MSIFSKPTVASVLGIDKTVAKLQAVAKAHEDQAAADRVYAAQLISAAREAEQSAKAADAEVRLANAAITGIKNVLHVCGLSNE